MDDPILPNFWVENPPYNWETLGDAPSYRYKKNHLLFLEGTKMDTVYLIKNGKVKLFITSDDGSEKIVGYVGQNSIIGTSSLFYDAQYMYSAATVTNCTLLKFNREDFLNQVMSNQELMMQLFKIMSLRIRILTTHSLDLSFKHSYRRLCHALLQLCDTYGKKRDDGSIFIDFHLTQKDLSELIGTTRVTIANHLKKLTDFKIISKEKKNYIVIDYEALKNES